MGRGLGPGQWGQDNEKRHLGKVLKEVREAAFQGSRIRPRPKEQPRVTEKKKEGAWGENGDWRIGTAESRSPGSGF